MPEVKVSVIIPAYNADNYIRETIESVKAQSFTSWEIIVVNDGSKDRTVEFVEGYLAENIRLINQINSGVASARNKGIEIAIGEYLVFLDADDVLTTEFMHVRVQALDENPDLGFVGGIVETFPRKSSLKKAAAINPESEILFFNPEYSTVPSNYMVRSSVLYNNSLRFNTGLNSTADRFFILQLAKISKGLYLDTEKGKLLYRISENSMSHYINIPLLTDNEKFYYELGKANLLPVMKRDSFKAQYFFSLAMGFTKIRKLKSGFKYFSKSFSASPKIFFNLLIKKILHTFKKG